MDDFSRDYPGGACRKAFLGCPGVTCPTNQNSHPLIKIDSPIVRSIWGRTRTQSEVTYINFDFGKSRLPSLFKSVFSVTRALLLSATVLRFVLVIPLLLGHRDC
jgi:hypothetical protein